MHRKRLGHPALKSRKLGQWLDSMMVAKRDLTRKLRAAHWPNGSRDERRFPTSKDSRSNRVAVSKVGEFTERVPAIRAARVGRLQPDKAGARRGHGVAWLPIADIELHNTVS
jgi:hypothetical protein